ncbi:methylmalonyl Co-A mutase-associated GTPase MeaB [Chloroflexota bacterium]
MELVQRMLSGDQLSLARLITLVERETEDVPEIMRLIYPHTGKAHCIGVTGPPGGGKSTLVDRLVSQVRAQGLTAGIVAVDPTSPFSGGAVLGDRVRMQRHYLDSGVFIRSMATRGGYGGLPRAAKGVIKLLDAFGKDYIVVETVGVGQVELDIMKRADTTVVVLVPGAGDNVQTMKAGIMEIADVFVVNKADQQGAEQLVVELETMLEMSPDRSWWKVPVLATQAHRGIGIGELYQQIESHRQALVQSGQLSDRRKVQRKDEVLENVQYKIQVQFLDLVERDGEFAAIMKRVEGGELDPYSAVEEIFSSESLLQSCLSGAEEEKGKWEPPNK